MSMAPRLPKWRMRSLTCAGHEVLTQRVIASPSGLIASLPHTGQ